MNFKKALCLPLALGLSLTPACAVDLIKFERALTSSEGVVGEVHGANAETGVYVLTYRNPEDFFDYMEMSLVSNSPAVAASMAQAQRHDKVRIKGHFMDNRSPQKHIEVDSFEIVKKYAPTPAIPSHDYEARIPQDLEGKERETFLVHAVHAGGKILVVEYKDAVIPIYVKNGALTKDLARNDLVRLTYKLQKHPDRPVHLQLNETAASPVEVVEAVTAMHGKDALVEGALILFPKSPQVVFNVFAVLQKLPGGLQRQYTLANFTSPENFAKIREKLQKAWDAAPEAESGRNKLISTKVRVRVRGKFNQVDPNQANVQVLLDGPESIEVL